MKSLKTKKRKSHNRGKSTSKVEVLNVSINGVWLYVKGKEYFLTYKEFPWFEKATISEIVNVSLPHPNHLRWEQLDIDLLIDSLKTPEKFPLKYKT